MNIENTMLIMKQFEEIQKEMKTIGEIEALSIGKTVTMFLKEK